jgi:hypothetical protein
VQLLYIGRQMEVNCRVFRENSSVLLGRSPGPLIQSGHVSEFWNTADGGLAARYAGRL